MYRSSRPPASPHTNLLTNPRNQLGPTPIGDRPRKFPSERQRICASSSAPFRLSPAARAGSGAVSSEPELETLAASRGVRPAASGRGCASGGSPGRRRRVRRGGVGSPRRGPGRRREGERWAARVGKCER
jgi:hypothetical protein